MKQKKYFKVPLAVACALFLVGGAASAATIAVSNGTVPVAGGDVTITANFTGDGVVVAYQSDVLYDATKFSSVVTTNQGTGLCSVLSPGVIRLLDGTADNSPLGNTTTCSILFTANAGSGGDVEALTLGGVQELNNSAGDALPLSDHTFTNGSITWLAGPPPDVELTFNPASAVAFGGGALGDNVSASITVGSTGSIGTGTVDNCVISGADAAAFSVTGGDPTTAPPNGAIALQATLGGAALSASLDCDVADASAATTHHWDLTAPAGTVLAPPTVGAPTVGPASPSTGAGTITFPVTAPGDVGGPAANVSCTVTSGDFTITPDPFNLTFPAGSGASQSIPYTCNPTDAAYIGILTCSGAINDEFGLECPEFSAVVEAHKPNFIPASSLWSKLALFGMLGALGMLVLGFRRSH